MTIYSFILGWLLDQTRVFIIGTMINFSKCFFALVLAIFSTSIIMAQSSAEANRLTTFDSAVGIENTDLYQGIVYVERYRTVNENTQFYQANRFFQGAVNYNGQNFYDLDLKYDVYQDNVLLRLKNSVGGGTLQLLRDYVNSFTIDGHNFIKLEREKVNGELNTYGFYEDAYKGPYFNFYSKPVKRSFERKDRSAVYYEFKDGKSEYVLFYDGKHHQVDSKGDFIDLFPNLKKEINRFYNLARSLRNSDPDAFHVSLLKRIEILLSQTNNQ